jgi:dynein heavy chain 2, cytosolic
MMKVSFVVSSSQVSLTLSIVRFGKTLIVKDLSTIEPVLMPLIKKEFLKVGPRLTLDIGDKSIDYHESFCLYLVTSQSSFTLAPDLAGYVNDINFTITRAGLAGQLLGQTLKHEMPKLETQKMDLLKKEDDLKIELSRLEDSLLSELANSQGNILENRNLITSLEETKTKSIVIARSLEDSQLLQVSLDAERQKYSPISDFASRLFFVINDLQKLNNMYRFSLSSFVRLFDEALNSTDASNEEAENRVKALISALEKLVYRYVSRSLLQADRHTFALYLVHSLNPTYFEANEWELFNGVATSSDFSSMKTPEWVPEERKLQFRQFLVFYTNFRIPCQH